MSYYTPCKNLCLWNCVSIFRAKGKGQNLQKSEMDQKQEVSAFSYHLLFDLCRFLRMGVSQDYEHNGEVENVFTSCFVCQTGSGSIFLTVIDQIVPFSQGGGFSGLQTQWWSLKCIQLLFCSPNRKWQHFPVRNWLICVVFTGRGFLGMTNAMVKGKMWKRHKLISYMQEIPVWRVKEKVTTLDFTIVFRIPRNPFMRELHESINYRQEMAGTSCLASKTGSDDISTSPLGA